MSGARTQSVRRAPSVRGEARALRLSLAERPGVAAEARACTARFLADVSDPGVVRDAVLLVSELVGNAQRHTRAGPRALLLVRGAGVLRIEVSDSSHRPPVPREPYGSYRTYGSNEADGTDGADGTDETNGADGTNGTDGPGGSNGAGGLGLFLVGRLSRCWGWRLLRTGKAVWCELRVPP